MTKHLETSGLCTDDDAHMKRIELEFSSAQILELDGHPIGLIKVSRRINDWEILQVQLIPELQRMGIGTTVIQEILSEADKHAVPVRLSVLNTNYAKRLYERLGFVCAEESEYSCTMVRSNDA